MERERERERVLNIRGRITKFFFLGALSMLNILKIRGFVMMNHKNNVALADMPRNSHLIFQWLSLDDSEYL
jgi:hypothetical protein